MEFACPLPSVLPSTAREAFQAPEGFWYVLDRVTGEFLSGKPFAKVTWTSGLDAHGRPQNVVKPTPEGTPVYPHLAGATNSPAPTWVSSRANAASAAIKEAYGEFAPQFEKSSEHKITTTWAGTVDLVRKLQAGEVFDVVIRLDGTLSGEHGIGLAKRDFMPRALDAGALALMQRIKDAFDPDGILNPGKLLPDRISP